MGWIINLGQRALASAGRTLRLARDGPHARGPAGPAAAPARRAARRRAARRAASPTPAASRCCAASTSRSRPGEVARGLRPDRRGEVVAARARAALLRPDARGRAARRPRRARRCRSPTSTRATALVTQRPILFSESLRDNLTAGRPDAPWEEVAGGLRGRGRDRVRRRAARGLRHDDRRARRQPVRRPAPARRAGARAAQRRAGARARRPALGRRHRRPSCGSSPACAARWPAGRSCSPRSGSRRSRWPTGSWCSRRARSSRRGRRRSCSRAAAPSPRCSVRTPLRRSPPTGLRRLRRHVEERRGWLALLLGCAIGRGVRPERQLAAGARGDQRRHRAARRARAGARVGRLPRPSASAGWALFGFVIRGMARFGQGSCSACGASCSTISPRCRCATSPSSGPAGSSPA